MCEAIDVGLHDMVEAGLARGLKVDSTNDEVATAILQELDAPLKPFKIKLPTWDDCVDMLEDLYAQTVNHEQITIASPSARETAAPGTN